MTRKTLRLTQRFASTLHYLMDAGGRPRPCLHYGRWLRIRSVVGMLLLAVWLALPSFQWGDLPLIRIDLSSPQIIFAGRSFWGGQDAVLFLLLLAWLGSFVLTLAVLAPRFVCSFLCPHRLCSDFLMPTLQAILLEWGSGRGLRSLAWRPVRQTLTWIVTYIVCLILIRPLVELMSAPYPQAGSGEYLSSSWYGLVMDPRIHPFALVIQVALAFLLHLDLSTFREITCLHLCFVGRVLNTMATFGGMGFRYDASIGEPRLQHSTQMEDEIPIDEPHPGKTLVCDDCEACIKACPTGHDIRSGHTLHCVDCGACSDACIAMRHKRGIKIPLITLHPLDGKPWAKIRRMRFAAPLLMCGLTLAVALHVHLSPSLILQMHSDGSRSHLIDLPNGSVAKQTFQIDVKNLDQHPLRLKIKVHPKYPGYISEGAEIEAPPNMRSLHTITMTIPCKDIMMGNNHTGIMIWDHLEVLRAYFPLTVPSPLGFAEEKPQE